MSETHWGGENSDLQVLWEDGDRVFCRTWRDGADGERQPFMAVLSAGKHPTPGSINRLAHEYELKEYLDSAWAVRPLEFVRVPDRTMLVLDASVGEPLSRLIGPTMDVERFLRLAATLSAALGHLHERGIV